MWFGAHYNQEVRFSSAVKCKKGPQVLTWLLKDEIIIIKIIIKLLNIEKIRIGLIHLSHTMAEARL